eukprot:augustus_masked-scaffold_76-processed-gene-0.79-mRNA-1 protein AED:1.00 eAED:1.00 QI:0/0/0/0/1/1/3/0/254
MVVMHWLKTLKVKDIRALLDMRDAYLDIYNGEKESNLWIHVDPELKQSLSSAGVTKEGLVDYLMKYMREHEAYEGEDTLHTIAEKVTWPSEGPFLELLNTYMSSAMGCIMWKQLKENTQKFEVLKALNKRLPLQLQIREARLKSEVRRAHQKTRRGGKQKRRHSISSDESRRGRGNKYYHRRSRSPSPRGTLKRVNWEREVLMEVFAKVDGLQKGWLQIGTHVDPYGREGSYKVQAVLRHNGVSHLWEEGDVPL